ADLAGAPVEDEVDVGSEVLAHVLRGCGADPPKAVRRGSGDAPAEFAQQRECDRMPGNTDADRVLVPGQIAAHAGSAPQHQGERPRPEALGELAGVLGNVARPSTQLSRVADVDDHGVIRRPALHGVDPRNRGRVGRIGPQPVHRLGRKGDQASATQDRRGLLDRSQGDAGQPGSLAFITASACAARNCTSRSASFASPSASIDTANRPAFAAPASPIAKVATGMPLGICTMDSSESCPWRYLDGMGTPSTGKVVFAATTPARWAAPPAPAMKQRAPPAARRSTQASSASGVRWAESTLLSKGTAKSLSCFAA